MVRSTLFVGLLATSLVTLVSAQRGTLSGTSSGLLGGLLGLGGLSSQWSCDETTGIKSRIVQTTNRRGQTTATTESAPCDPVSCTVYPRTSDPGNFGACVEESDGWFKYKVLSIQVEAKYGGFCPTAQQRTIRDPCPPVPCVLKTPAQDTGSFGACQDDGGDVWYKHKFLGTQTPALYGGSCPGPQDPSRDYRELCPAVPCVVKTPAQDTGSFGACQDDGGDVWYKHKFLGTQTPAQYGGSCPSPQDPSRDYRELCPAVACVVKTPAQDTDSFGACQDDGGDVWYKHKFLGTQTPAQYGGSCPGAQDPSRDYRELCPAVACVLKTPAQDTGAFGACQDDGGDVWYKHKFLGTQTPAQYGGSCPGPQDPARDYRELCPPVPCVVKTPAQDTDSFGACRDDGGDVWYKHKFLGTQTPAQYGGACPGPQDPARDYSELCPAVACVVKTPAQDTDSFGACQDDGGDVWYKHKFLGTQTPAQYGGSCPGPQDPSRDYRELCPAVDCVLKTSAQDTGSFGACQDDGGDVWYKHKFLGTQTAAQYGGSCPGPQDPARDYRELCPAVPCVVKTSSQDTGSFGACQDDGGDVWYKHKFLGTQTPAQYGGSCPGPQDSSRDYRELCLAVPCVLKTPAQDTGSFGACENVNGGWSKLKYLGTQTAAQYGGSCPGPQDPSRAYREVCPAVACVVKTPAEDTGAFGACQQEATGWFKYKTLGIKTPALYGGSCPSESDRSYRAPCVRTCRSLPPGRGIGAASYFETITTTTSAACCDLCRQRPRCESYVFYTHNRQCWIQSAQRTLFASATAIGGTISSA